MRSRFWRTTIVAVLLTIILGGGFLLTVSGRPVTAATAVVFDPASFKQKIKEFFEKIREQQWKKAAVTALDKAAQSFINRLAQQTAGYIASGGPGKTSLQRRESFGGIVRKSGEAALGDFVQDLSERTQLDDLGLNLCNPTAQLKANISLQLLDDTNPIAPSQCDIRDIQDNWRRFAQNSVGANINIGYGDQFGASGSLTGPGVGEGRCVPYDYVDGRCGFSGDNTSQAGICEVMASSDPETQVSTRTYCNTDSDCAAINGAICSIFNFSCESDTQCTVAGTVCTKAQGGPCEADEDCEEDYECDEGPVSPGVPWLDITKDLNPSEKLKTLNDLFSPQQSDLGGVLLIGEAARRQQELQKKYAELNAVTCKGYKDVGFKTLGNDADYVSRTCDEIERLDQQTGDKSHTAEDTKTAVYSLGESGFWLNAANIFGRSLVAGLLKKYIKNDSFSLSLVSQGTNTRTVRQNIVQQLRDGATSPLNFLNTNQVINTIADAHKPALDTVNRFDYLSNFTICPDDRNNVELDNCTIDDNLAAAIRDKKTLAEAIADGTMNGGLPLISNLNISLNSDPFCIRNGYCHSNIVRLRKYRIVPVGWEIAASLSSIDDPVTLKEAMDCFNNGPLCKYDPQSNIYFQLVDPNWVLKAPETQCKSFAYGPKLIDIDTAERQKYCADPISCLGEDDSGNCTNGFGYCTKEKSVWRFAGSQCPEQYASCTIYTKSIDNQVVSYLADSLDSCDASQNGCLWYSKSQDNVGSVTNPTLAWNPNDRLYLNSGARVCPLDQVGCTQYLSLATPRVNLVPNGDFDYFTPNAATDYADPNWLNDTQTDLFDGWQGSATLMTTRDNAYYGSIGLRIAPAAAGAPKVRVSTTVQTGILTDQTYTLSWLGKSDAACTVDVAVGSQSTPAQSTTVTYSNSWKRYELSVKFDVNNLDTLASISFTGCAVAGSGDTTSYIDGVKFELSSSASGFTQYGENGKIYGKSQFQCTKDDVGCDRYSPVGGGAPVPGKINSNDICPAECVGYQNYLELSNYFDALEAVPATAPAPRPVNFIATTGKSCSATQLNCEEFTNLDEVAEGGEGKYYFNYVRQCVDDPLGTTYYTLEGSDTSGYQVRTWRLLPTNLPSGQPCTNVDLGGKTCIDNAANTTATTCSAADLQTNLDCREFFDISGNPHYMLESRVIVSSNDCEAFRRSSTGRTFFALKSESLTCNAQFNGCREYRGNQGNNLHVIFKDTFESGVVIPWQSNLTLSTEAPNTGGHSLANFSVQANGTPNPATTQMNRFGQVLPTMSAGRDLYIDFWMKNLEPVKIRFVLGSTFIADTFFDELVVPSVSGWQHYEVGPLLLTTDKANSRFRALIAPVSTGGSTPHVYLDNVMLQDSGANILMVKNSWKTPQSCDQPFTGAMLGCQSYTNTAGTTYNLKSFSRLCQQDVIGCQAFVDTKNSSDPFQRVYHSGDPSEITVPSDSISYFVYKQENLCFAENKGCSALGKPQLNLDLPENHPQYIAGYSVETLINDPDTYDTTLCSDDGLFCEEYSSSRGTTAFFKDPRSRVCAYKENVSIAGQLFTGWFQSASLQAGSTAVGCSDDGVLPYTSLDFKLYSNLDANYDRWAGQCTAQYDRCTEFKDPLDTESEETLTNAEFGLVPGWTSRSLAGNTLVDIPNNGGANDMFEVNSSLQYGISRANPKGGAVLTQEPVNLDSTGIYTMSTDVNIRSLPADPNATVSQSVSCYWESATDQDFCVDAAGTYNYAAPCTNGTSTVCAPGYSCTAKRMVSPSYCNDSVTGDTTTIPCTTNAQCISRNPNYTCEINGVNASNPDRDHVLTYTITADVSKLNLWQHVSRSIDLGTDGRAKELVYCELNLTQSRSAVTTYCVDGSGKAAASPQTCTVNANCTTAPYTTCGGISEVWWQNPALKEAKGYFYLDDQLIDSSSCSGQVGKRDGCLLFLDMSTRGSKLYDAANTYAVSAAVNGAQVPPASCDPSNTTCTNDSNRIIKVTRDRQCSEWLACRSTTQVFDPSTNSYRQLCDQVGVCDKYLAGTDVLSCARWVNPSKQQLGYGLYTNRSFDQNPAEYTGYSIYNTYPVGTLELVDVSNNGLSGIAEGPDPKNQDYRLVKVIDSCDSPNQYEEPCGPVDPLNITDKLGRCFTPNKCAVGIDGSHFSRTSDFVIKSTTRAWAEKDSPFPYSVVESDTGSSRKVKFGFQEANVCDSRNSSCETQYYKFRYGSSTGNVVRYYSTEVNFQSTTIPSCICGGGKQDGQACLSDDIEGRLGCTNNLAQSCSSDGECPSGNKCIDTGDGKLTADERCPDNGTPLYLKRAESYINLPGFCLEPDNRANINASQDQRACLSWLPIDNAPVGYDFYNQSREAGYSYKIPAYYCLEFGLYEQRTRYFLGTRCSNDCRKIKVDPDYKVIDRGRFGATCHGYHKHANCYAEPIGGAGLYQYDGDTVYNEKLPDASCQILAQAVDERGENAAKTNLFWSGYGGGAGYTVGNLNPPLGYKLGQDDTPFGSAVPTSLGFITERLIIRNPVEVPRAGSPYACSSTDKACAYLNEASGSTAAVKGWTKNPAYKGGEYYDTGVLRLKEIYKKLFGLYRWGIGDSCDYTVCGRTDDPTPGQTTGSYFGGKFCDPSEPNTCNADATGVNCQPISNKCVNSVFTSTDPASSLFGDCTRCPVGLHTEAKPSKRCESDLEFATQAACDAADLDPGTPSVSCSSLGYSCQQVDPSNTSSPWRCYSATFAGNDCKIPFDSAGSLIPTYLECRLNGSSGVSTCFYAGFDTRVECQNLSDCTANDDGNTDNLIGELQAINKQAYCADAVIEGVQDYGDGSFCVGQPFTSGPTTPQDNDYNFDYAPIHCEGGTTVVNDLGETLSGANICKTEGACLPSYLVKYKAVPPALDGEPICRLEPTGYLPLCIRDASNTCSGYPKDRIIDASTARTGTFPLDETSKENATRAPYIIPTVCDSQGLNCTQSIKTNEFDVPTGPSSPVNDNAFSVNNVTGSASYLEGFQNFLVSLSFYMGADKNHIPIRYIDIDWGDGLRQSRIGYYKNHMDQCVDPYSTLGPKTVAQEPLDYAATPQACRVGYRNYLHVYTYDTNYLCGTCGSTTRECGRDEDCTGGLQCNPNPNSNASCYRPWVMAQDNWGWCTNGVYGEVGLGCKNTQILNPAVPPAPGTPTDGYVKFQGLIKVYKDPKP